ncbi:MAG: dihydrofolate reductase family protein [Alphaproteobacteria bacterium]|nr:dihydrofolate reductase family protein [Alphaproteobacteria bacterium]
MHITGIMAADPRGIVGKGHDLPWHYPDETAHFRNTVKGHIIIMGRCSFESAPIDLFEECDTIVFTRDKTFDPHTPRTTVVHSIEAFNAILPLKTNQHVFMIGGADLARIFLKEGLINDFLLTTIHKEYEGDVVLDLDLFTHWPFIVVEKTANYTIRRYTKPYTGTE